MLSWFVSGSDKLWNTFNFCNIGNVIKPAAIDLPVNGSGNQVTRDDGIGTK